MVAVALIDGEVTPYQFLKERIRRPDARELLMKVNTHTNFPLKTLWRAVDYLDPYTSVYPDKMPVKVSITLNSGEELSRSVNISKDSLPVR